MAIRKRVILKSSKKTKANKKEAPISKTEHPKNISSIEFMKLDFGNETSLFEAIKNLKRIKKRGAIQNIFEALKSHLNEKNVDECFKILLKKTTHKHLKVYFGDLMTQYLDSKKIPYNDNFHQIIFRFEQMAESIKAKRAFSKKIKRKSHSTSSKGGGNTISKAYGRPGNYGKLISNLPRS